MEMKTYNVVFNNSDNSNNKGFKHSFDYCKNYILENNGTNNSYFADYKGGIVDVICNENGESVYSETIR